MLRVAVCTLCLLPGILNAGDVPELPEIPGLIRTAIGVTRGDMPIGAYVHREDVDFATRKCRITFIGGLDGDRRSTTAVIEALRWFHTHDDAAAYRELFILSGVPCGNPDGVKNDLGQQNSAGGTPGRGYPPEGKYYQSQTAPESQYLWRWLELHAADIVIDLRAGEEKAWRVPRVDAPWRRDFVKETRLAPQIPLDDPSSLAFACAEELSPALEVTLGEAGGVDVCKEFLARQVVGLIDEHSSQARKRIQQRLARKDTDLCPELVAIYCKPFKKTLYYHVLPHIAAHRLNAVRSGLTTPHQFQDYDDETSWEVPKSSSELAGLLFVSEGRLSPWRSTFLKAADLALDKEGKPLPEPPFHNEMSDAVFMNCPVLAGAGVMGGGKKYFDACAAHFEFIRGLCQRDDGLYRHSPLAEAAWGRGNGFAALGLALVLEDFPKSHPARPKLLAAFQQHMAALKEHQDYTGCWHQVIDRPESYREFTCTAMIGFAMARGIRGGWLDKEEYQSCVDQAWQAVKIRTLPDGEFLDVCTGTGKQKSLRDYYDREALQGRDARGGAMMLMFMSERFGPPLVER